MKSFLTLSKYAEGPRRDTDDIFSVPSLAICHEKVFSIKLVCTLRKHMSLGQSHCFNTWLRAGPLKYQF